MRLIATSHAEGHLIEQRLRAVAHVLGPSITVEACLPSGHVIRASAGHPPAALLQEIEQALGGSVDAEQLP